MRFFVSINNTKCIFTAWSEQKVVFPTCVVDDFEHDVASVGVERITSCEIYAACVIKCSAVRYHLVGVMLIESDQVGNLNASRINHGQSLTFVEEKRGSRSWFELDCAIRECFGRLHRCVEVGSEIV